VEDLVSEEGSRAVRDIRNEARSEDDVQGAERAAIEPDDERFAIERYLAHLSAELDVGQPAGDPRQVLTEFLATDPGLLPVEEAVQALVGAEK